MYNEEFCPGTRNTPFEKPNYGPRGPPSHFGRGGPPAVRHIGMPDVPPNIRGPCTMRFNHGMGPPMMRGPPNMPRGPPGPHLGPRSPQFNSPRPPHSGMPGNIFPRPPMMTLFGHGPPSNFPHNFQNLGNSSSPEQNVMDLSETWVETKTPEGKLYYYNALTREAAWTKPEIGKIISQTEIEAMASASNTPDENKKKSVNPSSGTQNLNLFTTGPISGMSTMPTSGMRMMPPALMGMLPPLFTVPPPGTIPGASFPRFGPPPFSMSNSQANDSAVNDCTEVKTIASENKIDRDWVEYKAENGRVYYYDKITGETTWNKPISYQNNVEMSESANDDVPINTDGNKENANDTTMSSEMMETDEFSECKTSCFKIEPDSTSEILENETSGAMGNKLIKTNSIEAEQKQEPQVQQQVDKTRPVSSTPVSGTGWCVVWTGDGRVFFFNPSSMTSIWKIPEELKGRTDVEKLILYPPNSEITKDAEKNETENVPDSKKVKLDESVGNGEKENSETEGVTKVINSIAFDKESAIEAELRAAKERDRISLDVRMKEFKQLLVEKMVSAYNTWEKELHKIVFDPRYLLLTSKERKQVFERYVKERAEEERMEKKKQLRERKDEFRKLLSEAGLTTKSTFSEFAQRFGKDERFKVLEKMRDRESLFNDYVQDIRRKERNEKLTQREKARRDFNELLKEQNNLDRHSHWSDVKKLLSEDSRYKAVDSSSLREEWFKEYTNKLSRDFDQDSNKDREKQERVEASIREREKEVQRTLSSHLRERDKERELHKHEEAIQHFKALLTDLVRFTDIPWHEVKKTLRKDHRWGVARALEKEEREHIFNEHINLLYRKKKEKFRELLDETHDITLTSSWRDVKKLIKDDVRCSKFSSSDRKCEKEFKEYLKDKMVAAKADLRELLKETKIITYKSKKLIEETDHLLDIEKVLQNDKRYLILQCVEDERKELLMAYIDTLDRKGPPPPPTASEPSRRSAK